jgi:sugar diacid utilization regulator
MAVDLPGRDISGAHRNIDVGAAARLLAADIDVEQAGEAISNEIMREVWPDQDDPSFYDAVLRSTTDNLATIFAMMAGAEIGPELPLAAMEFAEVTARMGVPIGEVDKAYRVGTGALWNMWFDAARERADGGPIDELISGPTMAIHAYVNRTLDAVALRHQQVRGELHRTLRELRRRTLLQLLDGTAEGDPDELTQTLEYRLADTHLAVLLHTADTRPPERELTALRAAVDARDSLLLQHGPRSWVMWLGRTHGFDPHQLAQLARVLTATGLTASVGEPANGLDGFRRTRRQALETARVQRAFGTTQHRVLWAREVRLETLLLADEARARDFIADELGCLGTADSSCGRLRETLLAWLATGSHVSAAALLGVHENTVRNRVRAAEELLGTPLLGRRTELQMALRLERVLSPPSDADIAAAA